MGFNERNQTFKYDDEVILMRPLYLSDLNCQPHIKKPTGNIILPAGHRGIYKGEGCTDGTVRISFSAMPQDYWDSKIGDRAYRKDGNWSVNADLVKPVKQDIFVAGSKHVMPFGFTFASGVETPAGAEVIVVKDGIFDDDVRVEFMDADGDWRLRYVKWYTLVPSTKITSAPALLWGKYEYGKTHDFTDDASLMVVFIRDVTRSELGGNGYIAPVSSTNRLMAHAGQLGKVDWLNLRSADVKNPARVTFLDHSKGDPVLDFWQLPLDCIIPVLGYGTAEMLTYAEYSMEEGDDGLWKVGDIATVFMGTHDTMFDANDKLVVNEDSVNMTFRDEDEVYIITVDKDVADDEDGLVYLISHSEDATSQSLWVRKCDLIDPE